LRVGQREKTNSVLTSSKESIFSLQYYYHFNMLNIQNLKIKFEISNLNFKKLKKLFSTMYLITRIDGVGGIK